MDNILDLHLYFVKNPSIKLLIDRQQSKFATTHPHITNVLQINSLKPFSLISWWLCWFQKKMSSPSQVRDDSAGFRKKWALHLCIIHHNRDIDTCSCAILTSTLMQLLTWMCRGRFHHDIPILIINWSPKDISLEVKTLILLQLLITQGYRHPEICL